MTCLSQMKQRDTVAVGVIYVTSPRLFYISEQGKGLRYRLIRDIQAHDQIRHSSQDERPTFSIYIISENVFLLIKYKLLLLHLHTCSSFVPFVNTLTVCILFWVNY